MIIDIQNTEIEKYSALVRANRIGKRYAYVFTFGCQQNEADSEKIRAMALLMGYDITETPDNATLIIVNTCAIREHAEMKALSMLGRLKEFKKQNNEVIIGVLGCMAAEPGTVDALKRNFKYVSFTLEPSKLEKLPELVYRAMNEERSFVLGHDSPDILEGLQPVRKIKHRAWVSIMYGCNNFCSYCIVPYVRGRERSRESSDIINECRTLIDEGCKEITLLGQNVNSYKSDMSFSELLCSIAQISGDFILRFMTSHPKDVSDSLIDVMGKYKEKIAPYFHLPIQSGSNKVLRDMNRTYTKEKFIETVEKLRSAVPGIAISSDVIVGFPGESEEDFLETLDVLQQVKFDMVYAFIYSVRAGTKAEKMNGHLDEKIKGERLGRLLEVQDRISSQKNLPYEDTVQRVLVDSVSERNGKVLANSRTLTNKLVHFEADTDAVGEFRYVKITRAKDTHLLGEEMRG